VQKFDPRIMIVTRQNVYHRVTGRWLGHMSEFELEVPEPEDAAKPVGGEKSRAELYQEARAAGIPGASQMRKAELIEALEQLGRVRGEDQVEAGDASDGFDQA